MTRPAIDPNLKALLDAVPLEFTIDDGVEVAREKFRAVKPPAEMLPDMRIEERVVGHGDVGDVPVRIYWPPIDAHDDLPVVVFYHGGGWAIGDLDTHDHVARAHAIGAEAIVVSVDYRLAPEHPFPEGVEDAWAALQWVGEHAAELGGDPTRIAVAGDSAGGNLSAVMALRARDAGGPALVFQLLWYPVAVGDLTAPSFTENADAPLLNADVTKAFLTWYLPGVDMSDSKSLPTDLAPANAESLTGLAPAFIGTAEHDPLRDDGGKYAELLSAAGVPVQLSNESTMVHGYVSLAMVSPAATEATNRGLAALKAALHAK
jgi:acetyl esterase